MDIRQEQFDALANAQRERFETKLIEELRENFPVLKKVRRESLREYVHDIEAQSMKNGLKSAVQIRRLAIYTMGAKLYLKGTPHWFTTILSRREISIGNRLRMIGLRLEHELELQEP